MPSHPTVERYIDLYQKLYKREPKGLRQLNNDFVMVNNIQIRIQDLETLVKQLENEYREAQQKKRSTILKLVDWFRR